MKYTLHLYSTKTASVVIPVFCCDTGGKREEENVSRMNGFYDELRKSIMQYTEYDTFPEGGKYFAKSRVSDGGGLLTVTVDLRLRVKGEMQGKRKLTHTWSDGVVVEKRIID